MYGGELYAAAPIQASTFNGKMLFGAPKGVFKKCVGNLFRKRIKNR